MLIVDLNYTKPMSEVEKHLAAHRQFLSEHYDRGNFLASGPKDPRTGGIIVALVDEQTMKGIIQQDPFYQNQVAEYHITVFSPVLHCDEITDLV